MVNRYERAPRRVYEDLLELVADRDYFVLTTNVDHQFQLAGFDKKRLFCTQGDYGLWQCSRPCHQSIYDNEETVRRMVAEQRDMRIPPELIPRCPVCGRPMTMNLRADDSFVQDMGWYRAAKRYTDFINSHKGILFLELGVGYNTPGIIKYPFKRMTMDDPSSLYVCVNAERANARGLPQDRALSIEADIGEVLKDIKEQPTI